MSGAGTAAHPDAFDNGVMARRYGFPRACHKPDRIRIAWLKGWDAEDKRRAALTAAKTGGAK